MEGSGSWILISPYPVTKYYDFTIFCLKLFQHVGKLFLAGRLWVNRTGCDPWATACQPWHTSWIHFSCVPVRHPWGPLPMSLLPLIHTLPPNDSTASEASSGQFWSEGGYTENKAEIILFGEEWLLHIQSLARKFLHGYSSLWHTSITAHYWLPSVLIIPATSLTFSLQYYFMWFLTSRNLYGL